MKSEILPISIKYKPTSFDELPRMENVIIKCRKRNNGDFMLIEGARNIGKTLILNIIGSQLDNVLYLSGTDESIHNQLENQLRSFTQAPKECTVIIDNVDVISDKVIGLICCFCDLYAHKLAVYASCTNLAGLSNRFKVRFKIITIQPVEHCHLYDLAKHVVQSEKLPIGEQEIKYLIEKSNQCIPLLLCNMEKVRLVKLFSIEEWVVLSIFSESDRSDICALYSACKAGNYSHAFGILNTARNNGFTLLDILHILNNNLQTLLGFTRSPFLEISKLILSLIVKVSNGGLERDSVHEYELVNEMIKLLNR